MKGCNVAFGGQTSEDDNYIAPTVLTDCKWSDPVMQEEVIVLFMGGNCALHGR